MQDFFTGIEQWWANLSIAEQAPQILMATLIVVLGLVVARFLKVTCPPKTGPEVKLGSVL